VSLQAAKTALQRRNTTEIDYSEQKKAAQKKIRPTITQFFRSL
jgi:hypothetical protein